MCWVSFCCVSRRIEDSYADCHYAECLYAECLYAECPHAECPHAECRYAKCRYAECRDAILDARCRCDVKMSLSDRNFLKLNV
jgi:hypothetical protein